MWAIIIWIRFDKFVLSISAESDSRHFWCWNFHVQYTNTVVSYFILWQVSCNCVMFLVMQLCTFVCNKLNDDNNGKRNYWIYSQNFALSSNEISVKSSDAPRSQAGMSRSISPHPRKFVCLLGLLNRHRKHNVFTIRVVRPSSHPAVHCPSDNAYFAWSDMSVRCGFQ